ncbi:MAG: hypothetical protein MK110_00335 [Fuerstiella sp.]|nr:hypothetical protein [Fuerstiella sp.]
MCCFLRTLVCLVLIPAVLPATAADESQQISADTLRDDQLAVSGRYDRFERLLSQMADILGHEDPERAELLRRALSKGREQAISSQLGQIAEDLIQNNLGRALEEQDDVLKSLATLLQLLQSEDRRSELEKERERLNGLLKDVSNTLNRQKSARASTQNSTAPSSSAGKQQEIIDRTNNILDEIDAHEGQSTDSTQPGANSPTDSQSATESENSEESSPSDADQNTPDSEKGKPDQTDDDSKQGSENDGQPSPPSEDLGESSESDSGQTPPDADAQSEDSNSDTSGSQESQDQSGSNQPQSQNSNSSESNQQSQAQKTPGKEEVSNARQLMREALEQLQKQLRDEALEKQDGAIEELQKAIEELRKKLLQLREEEKEMILASLEARFQRMLSMQTQIYDETVDLSSTPVDDWLDTMFARSREVAQQQAELQVECERTLGLLKEDGTSVSIVLAVEDISIDMQTIAVRLRQSKVGTLTQTLESDNIEALKELIEATQREMQEMRGQENPPQQSQSAQQQKPPLVQLIAEIKILRSLQLRINRRTRRTDQLITEQSDDDQADLIEQLEELTARQQRLVRSAKELAERLDR